jgi:hypothetical protein
MSIAVIVAVAAIVMIATIAMIRHNHTTAQCCYQGHCDQYAFHWQLLENDPTSIQSPLLFAKPGSAVHPLPRTRPPTCRSIGMTLVRSAALLLLAIATGSIAAGPPTPMRLSMSDRTSIRDLETRSWIAWKNHDAAFFERFLAFDHVEVHADGIAGKAAVIEVVRSPACVVQDYSIGPLSMVPVSADTVLVTYRAEQNTACGTDRVPSPVWATSLYVKRDGRWVNVLYQHTPAG